ncbi:MULTISPECIES: hypothetical protein [unclassified Streptomyces]|uniref:hypothetical protein n=1 Tax=unclassified Streptomyces TaxID=2593676 RepID=UPI0013687081|nr:MULTISPECIES: hypothetical protein [unclassified Streptomyces]MYS20088.1 hypothetical protein [Streptomyces sp. SID4948]
MDTAKVELAAQRYEEAEGARRAAADDLRAEVAAALAQGADPREIEDAAGLSPEQLHLL